MDLDFPLILSWAVIISGAIWLIDAFAIQAASHSRSAGVSRRLVVEAQTTKPLVRSSKSRC